MTERIIDFLDALVATVGAVDRRYCLVEKRADVNGTNIPYKYKGNGNYESVNVDGGSVSYWRIVGKPSRDTIEGNTAIKNLSVSYPIRYVAMVRRDDINPFSFSEDVSNVLEGRSKDLQTQLQAKSVNVTVNSTDTDTTNIWGEEFTMPLTEPNYTRSMVMIDLTVTVIAARSCWESCDDFPDILQGFDWCDPSTYQRLTPAQITCLEGFLCGTCADATVQLNGTTVGTVASGDTESFTVNLDGSPSGSWDGTAWQVTSPPCDDATIELNGVEMTTIPSGDTENILVLQSNDMTQVGSKQGTHWRIDDSAISINGSPVADVKAEDALDIDVTQGGSPVGSWNGSAWIVPPCAAPSIAISYSNNTPTYGDTITITATPTGITPTSYTFIIAGNIDETITVQAGNTLSWVVNTLNPTIYVQATDVISFAASVDSSLTVSSITEASTFITAIETLTSDTMEGRQKDAVNRLRWMLGGNDTTNGTDLWTLLTATNAVWYIYCPNDDATAYFDGYKIDLLDPTHTGTFTNMVAGDISVDGVSGGGTKYFNMNVKPIQFDIDSIMCHFYQSKYQIDSSTSATPMGVHIGAFSAVSVGVSAFWNFSTLSAILRVNNASGGSYPTKRSITGVLSFGRSGASTVNVATNGSYNGSATVSSSTTIDFDIYGHGTHRTDTGAVQFPSENTYAGFAVTPWLSANEYLDFCEAWDEFNKIVITDGRKCNI